MPKVLAPKRPPREQVTAGIFAAAIGLFARRGYEATTMQDVAAKVGMTAPALYYYFESKQRLLFDVIELNLERFAGMLDVLLPLGIDSPEDELRAFVRTHLAFQLEDVDRARIYNAMFLGTGALLEALTPGQRSKILKFQGKVRNRLRAILERGVARKKFSIRDLTVTAMAILALGEFAVAWFAPHGRLKMTDVGEQYAELAVRMVTPPARLKSTPVVHIHNDRTVFPKGELR